MVLGLIMASVLGTLWAWIVWIIVGGFAGALADRLVQGDKLGILGNIVIGIVGGSARKGTSLRCSITLHFYAILP